MYVAKVRIGTELQSVYMAKVRIEIALICIHLQFCKVGKTPKRVGNSAAQLVIVKSPANTMRDMVRRGCGMYRIQNKISYFKTVSSRQSLPPIED